MEAIGWIGEGFNKHYDIEYFKLTYENSVDFDKVFKFAFVRNPYDRFASGVIGHTIQSPIMDEILGLMPPEGIKKMDKERFIAFTLAHKDRFDDLVVLRQQHKFINIDGKNMMDFIGRFESLQEDFDELCVKLGFNPTILPHMMKGRYNDYSHLWTPETREIVTNYYSKDFEEFKYETI